MRIFSSKEYRLLIARLMSLTSISPWLLLACLGSHFSLVTMSQKHSLTKLSYLEPISAYGRRRTDAKLGLSQQGLTSALHY